METWLTKSYRAVFSPIGVYPYENYGVVSWAFEKKARDETQFRNGHAFRDIIHLDLVQFEAL